MIQILLLQPNIIHVADQSEKKGLFKDLSSLVQNTLEDDEVRYTIQGFHYTSVAAEVKRWEIDATTALLYENSRKVVASNAKIRMFDAGGQITFIEGDEAHFFMGQRDFDLYENVKVTFPDGFVLTTSRAHYSADTGRVSSPADFYGESKKTKTEWLMVWGKGFIAHREEPIVNILSETRAKIHRFETNEVNDVLSDKANINRFTKVSYFFMNDNRRLVESTLGTLLVRSRRQEANYDAATHALNYMTAYDDVYIKETDPEKSKGGIQYATSQKADFISKDDKILLTGFPSVYQTSDTVTGELITVFRSKNLVEVTQANGFHDNSSSDR
jgi:LPS export ABC transporter protein LptC